MTSGGRITGGVLALVGGALLLISALTFSPFLIILFPGLVITILFTYIVAALAIVGGILLLVDKTAGGILAVIGGALAIVLCMIHVIGIYWMVDPLLPIWYVEGGIQIAIDPILALVNKIVGIAVGSEL